VEKTLHPLVDYIAASGDTMTDFAARLGASLGAIEAILNGEAPDIALARRIVAACGGAVELADFYPGRSEIADFAWRQSDEDLDAELMAGVLQYAVEALVSAPEGTGPVPERRASSENPLARIASEATIATYAALPPSDGNRRRRLAQALRPALEGILEERGAEPPTLEALDGAAWVAARLYLEAVKRRR